MAATTLTFSRKWSLLAFVAFVGTFALTRWSGISTAVSAGMALVPVLLIALCSFWVNGFRYGLVLPRARAEEESSREIALLAGCLITGLVAILFIVIGLAGR